MTPTVNRPGDAALRRGTIVLAALGLAIGAGLRLLGADGPLNTDELASLHFARQPFDRLWSLWMVRETNPPLFYSMLRAWEGAGLRGVVELRLLPIGGGLAAVGLIGLSAQLAFGRRAGLVALALSSVSMALIHYSLFLRGYVFALDAMLVSLIGLFQVVADPARYRGWLLFSAGSAAGLYFHTTMLVWPVAALLALAIHNRLGANHPVRVWIRPLLLSHGLLAAASAWWLYVTWRQVADGVATADWIAPLGPFDVARMFARRCMLSFGESALAKACAALVLVAAGLSAVRLGKTRSGMLVLLLAGASLAVFAGVNAFKPIALPRTMLWMSVFPLLLVSGAIASVARAGQRLALAGAGVAVLSLNTAQELRRAETGYEWRDSVRRVAATNQAVLLVGSEPVRDYAAIACSIYLAAPGCGFPVLVWPGQSVRAIGQGPVFVLNVAGYDESVDQLVRRAGLPLGPSAENMLYGPIARAALLSRSVEKPTHEVKSFR